MKEREFIYIVYSVLRVVLYIVVYIHEKLIHSKTNVFVQQNYDYESFFKKIK